MHSVRHIIGGQRVTMAIFGTTHERPQGGMYGNPNTAAKGKGADFRRFCFAPRRLDDFENCQKHWPSWWEGQGSCPPLTDKASVKRAALKDAEAKRKSAQTKRGEL